MSSEPSEQTTTLKVEDGVAAATGAAQGNRGRQCPFNDHHIHRDDLKKVWKECQEESFWHRALPFSLGSMAVTGGLIYKGVWNTSKVLGPIPKLAAAGILGYAVGKASYVGTCRSKFKELGIQGGPGFGPWSMGDGFGPGRRGNHHVCEECKKKTQAAPEKQA